MLQRNVSAAFFHDKNLFWGPTDHYLKNKYGTLITLINKELVHMKVHNKYNDLFFNHCTQISLLTTTFPFLLNLGWWTNIIMITAAIISKYAVDGLFGNAIKISLCITVGCGQT
ncbi:unnamed protein product, partial [Rotaria sp. Silwood2]